MRDAPGPARRAGTTPGDPAVTATRHLHAEREADADPDRERLVAGGEHEGGDEGLVGQLDREDRAEDDRR